MSSSLLLAFVSFPSSPFTGSGRVSGFPGHNADAEWLEDIGCTGALGADRAKLKLP